MKKHCFTLNDVKISQDKDVILCTGEYATVIQIDGKFSNNHQLFLNGKLLTDYYNNSRIREYCFYDIGFGIYCCPNFSENDLIEVFEFD